MKIPSLNTVLGRAMVTLDKKRTLTMTLGALSNYQMATGQRDLDVESLDQGARLIFELCRAEDPGLTLETISPHVTILNLPQIAHALSELCAGAKNTLGRGNS